MNYSSAEAASTASPTELTDISSDSVSHGGDRDCC